MCARAGASGVGAHVRAGLRGSIPIGRQTRIRLQAASSALELCDDEDLLGNRQSTPVAWQHQRSQALAVAAGVQHRHRLVEAGRRVVPYPLAGWLSVLVEGQ